MRNRWLIAALFCFTLVACIGYAYAEPGDLQAAHAQQLVAPVAPADNGDTLAAAIAPVVTAVAPLLPAPYGALAPLLIPLLGILTNIWWRWRGKDIKAEREKRRKQLLVDGIAYAEELGTAAKKTSAPVDKLQSAADFVLNGDIGKDPLFAGPVEVKQQVTAFLGRIPGVGATGNQVI